MLKTGHLRPATLGLALGALALSATAAPVTYNIDSAHTYPSFEVDHRGGLSLWRGKFNSTTGSVTLDKEAMTGSVDIEIDMSSIDFGHDGLNDHTRGDDPGMLNVSEHPTATYTGTLANWQNGEPTAVQGELTMHGVTLPVNLEIRDFHCTEIQGRDVCGADAYGEFDRGDFGVNFGSASLLSEQS